MSENDDADRQFGLLFDHLFALVRFSDAGGRRTRVNAPWMKFTCVAQERCHGEGWLQSIHPEDLERCRERYRMAQIQHIPVEIEYRLRRADGIFRVVADHGVPVFDDTRRFVGIASCCIDITRRKDAERLAAERDRELRFIADALPMLIARFDHSARYQFASKAYTTWFGLDPAAMHGKAFEEVMGQANSERVRPHVESVARGDRLSFRSDIPYRHGGRHRMHGEYIAEFSDEMNVAGWTSVVADAGNSLGDTKGETSAPEDEQRFRLLANNLPEMVLRLNGELRCIYANPALCRRLGLPLEDALGRQVVELGLVPQVATAIEASAGEALLTGAQQAFDFPVTILGDETKQMSCKLVPERARVVAGNLPFESVLAILVERSVADGREENEKSERVQHTCEPQLHEPPTQPGNIVDAGLGANEQFLSIVSHELRSPINGILSWTHVLESYLINTTPVVRRAVAGIRTGVQQQVRLIDDLLDATLVMTGKLSFVKRSVWLREPIEAALTSMLLPAQDKGIRLHNEVRLRSESVEGDPDRLQQIFWNLLSNAVRFTPEGGHVWLRADEADGNAIIEVRDSGKGIAPEFLPHLFEPFRQAGEPSTRRVGGVGLGLALVKRLVTLHDGQVAADSSGVGRGATFRVTLPLRAQATLDDVAQTLHAAQHSASLAGLHVLVVDDEPEARAALSLALSHAGARVSVARSGQEAAAVLCTLANGNGRPDVAVCDIAMPDQDGYELLQQVRDWEKAHDIAPASRVPAIAVTAFAQKNDRLHAYSKGFQMHLTKPVAPAELIDAIAMLASDEKRR